MITSWRDNWGIGAFSFYVAQLAGGPSEESELVGFRWPDFRESQFAVINMVPNADVANLIDLGESQNVHGYDKARQAERLARLALAHDYGKDIAYSGPRYKSHKLVGTKFIVKFDHVGKGSTAAKMTPVLCDPPTKGRSGIDSKEWKVEIDVSGTEELTGFGILAYDPLIEKPAVHWQWPRYGVNRIVCPQARIVGKDTIEVWSEEITDPKQIIGLRYAWPGLPKYNLYNLDGLPAFPFRTDTLKFGLQLLLDQSRAKWRGSIETGDATDR